MAETLGRTNTSRIIDFGANDGSIYTPGYAIYENDKIARVALFNYINDPTGASDLTVNINVGGGQTGQPNGVPASVKVKYVRNETHSRVLSFSCKTWHECLSAEFL